MNPNEELIANLETFEKLIAPEEPSLMTKHKLSMLISAMKNNLPEAINKHNQDKLDGLEQYEHRPDYDGGSRMQEEWHGGYLTYEDVKKAFCE